MKLLSEDSTFSLDEGYAWKSLKEDAEAAGPADKLRAVEEREKRQRVDQCLTSVMTVPTHTHNHMTAGPLHWFGIHSCCCGGFLADDD